MVSNRILLGSVAFGISFALSLVTSRNFNQALGTGIVSVPAVWVATNIVNRRQRQQGESRLAALTEQIRLLQQRRIDEYEAVLHLATERQRLETSLYYMQSPLPPSLAVPSLAGTASPLAQLSPALEPTQLMSAIAPSKPALSWDLSVAPVQPVPTKSVPAPPGSTLAWSPHTLPTQLQDPPARDADDLSKFLADKKSAKRKIEAKLNALQAEQAQVQVQLKEERAALVEIAQTRKAEQAALDRLTQALPPLAEQKHALEAEVAALLAEVQVLTQRRESGSTPARQELPESAVRPGPPIPAITVAAIAVPPPAVARIQNHATALPEEWQALLEQLLDHEVHVLRAIAEQANPAAAIKKIAEAHLTMPELLVDAVNERALDTIGDLILASAANSVSIVPEHRTLVQRLLQADAVQKG